MIPMNGLGNRFRDEGYHLPKPLINILGKPMLFWLLDNLQLDAIDEVIVPYTTILDSYSFQQQLRDRYPNVKFRFFPLNQATRGAAETVYVALDNLDSESLKRNIMLMDCDTFYFDNIVQRYQASECKNNIFYFRDTQEHPIYSYIKHHMGLVTDIAEKQKISDLANCGVYCFESGQMLKEYCDKLLTAEQTQQGEFYISGVYKLLLEDQAYIGSSLVENFHCVGTPLQLKIFCENYTDIRPDRFCFDLDNTLVTLPKVAGDYTTVEPIERNINFLKHLKSLGHYIIIYTARRMRTHKGNVGMVMKDVGGLTHQQLKEFGIPYDELHFGKPYAAYYIDDLAVNCNLNLEKQIGYYNSTIKSRAFNHVEILTNMVIKSGNIEGERYYYKNIPGSVQDLFPKLLDETEDKIIIERIQGINLSYLYTNGALSKTTLETTLASLRRLHEISVANVEHDFTSKIIERHKSYNYSQFVGHKQVLDKIVEGIRSFDNQFTTVIHGDPVFTNILVDQTNGVKFIDMRGKENQELTIYGSPMYDVAKIYQSLVGYDFILNNVPVVVDRELVDCLLSWAELHYDYNETQIKAFAAGLYFSLIPLHDDEKCQQYYQMARDLIS